MLDLSIALATHNEEENIVRCLNSVASWTREIVVVDGNSIDRTREIARRYKAKVYTKVNPVNFHINKQKAIDHCTSKWVLQLDADEVVSSSLRKEIEQKIDNAEYNGYWIPRKNYFLGKFLKKGGQYPDYTLRLYRHGQGRLPQKSVHEQAIVNGKTGYLDNPLLHYPYKNFSVYLSKSFNRYTNHMALEMEKNRTELNLKNFFSYVCIKPIYWFLLTFVRHKGFVDGYQGFIFSVFSALHYPVAYYKFLSLKRND